MDPPARIPDNDLWYRLAKLHRRCGVLMIRVGAEEPKLWRVVIGGEKNVAGEGVTLLDAINRAVIAAEELGWPPAYEP